MRRVCLRMYLWKLSLYMPLPSTAKPAVDVKVYMKIFNFLPGSTFWGIPCVLYIRFMEKIDFEDYASSRKFAHTFWKFACLKLSTRFTSGQLSSRYKTSRNFMLYILFANKSLHLENSIYSKGFAQDMEFSRLDLFSWIVNATYISEKLRVLDRVKGNNVTTTTALH